MLFDWFGGKFGRDGGPSASGATALCNKPLSRMREREGPVAARQEGEGSTGGNTLTRPQALPASTLSRGAGEGSASAFPMSELVVDPAVAGQPAGEFPR